MDMSRTFLRPILAAGVVTATVGIFGLYIAHHPSTLRQIGQVAPSTFALLFVLYTIFLTTLVWIQRATLALCNIKLDRRESFLLIMYSSIINFFGPLQSGPAFRAAYLKRKYSISLRKYTQATLLYYGFYALFSGLFLLTYFIGVWALIGILVLIIGLTIMLRDGELLPARFKQLQLHHIGQLAVATLAQVATFALIFYVELNSFGQHIGRIASLVYTGAANFALFVSVTPGAIGFRESFVAFTQQLHHISSQLIVSASLLDRGVYVTFLGIQAVIVFGFHAERLLKTSEKDS